MVGSGTRPRHPRGSETLLRALGLTLVIVAGTSGCVSMTQIPNAPVDEHGSPIQVSDVMKRAVAVQSVLAMTDAERAAAYYVADNGSIDGLSAEALASYEPNAAFNASLTAVPGQVSVRIVPPSSLILVTEDPNGDIYCSVVGYDAVGRGHVDAHTPAECTGGWPGGEWDQPPIAGLPSLPPYEVPESPPAVVLP